MKQKVILVLILFLLLLIPIKAKAENYKFNTGDQIYISVWGHPDLQQEVVVGPDGEINFPLIGKIEVRGLTMQQLKEKLVAELSYYIKVKREQINVILREYKKVRVMILGAVNKPGSYYVDERGKVLDLISYAGGALKTADLENVKLKREDDFLKVNLTALLNEREKQENYHLQDGDVLYVPEDKISVIISGAVEKPGRYELKKGSFLSDLIAQAGGLTESAAEIKYISGDKIEKINKKELGSYSHILKEGDRIYISERKYTLKKFFYLIGGLNSLKNLLDIQIKW